MKVPIPMEVAFHFNHLPIREWAVYACDCKIWDEPVLVGGHCHMCDSPIEQIVVVPK